MSEWKLLNLVEVDASKKQRDFDKVSERLQKPSLPWQVPVILLSIVMVSFLLFLTWSEPRELVADTEPELAAVYRLYGEGNPFSIWQMWVTRSTNHAVLEEYAAVLTEASTIEKLDLQELSETYRFVYSDGTSVIYETYYQDDRMYFYHVNEEFTYEITDSRRLYQITMMDEYSDAKNYAWLLIAALTVYVVMSYFIGRKMRDAEDKKRSLPQHSTHWQTFVTISAWALIVILALAVSNLHFGVAILIFGVAMLINIGLERQYGQNGWRMLNFVVNSFWYAMILMNLFLS